jgi:hypothetical protein
MTCFDIGSYAAVGTNRTGPLLILGWTQVLPSQIHVSYKKLPDCPGAPIRPPYRTTTFRSSSYAAVIESRAEGLVGVFFLAQHPEENTQLSATGPLAASSPPKRKTSFLGLI